MTYISKSGRLSSRVAEAREVLANELGRSRKRSNVVLNTYIISEIASSRTNIRVAVDIVYISFVIFFRDAD